MASLRKGNFDGHYTDWRHKRVNAAIDYYGQGFFKDKSVLEVGCGWGDTGQYFADLGAKVTVSDARSEHITEAKSRYPKLECLVVDSETTKWPYDKDYDLVIHWGLLYHLQNPKEHLNLMLKHCRYICLETIVSDSSDPEYIKFRKEETKWDKGAWGMAFSGIGCIPSYAYVEKIFTDNSFSWERLSNPKRCNSGMHHYDWDREDNKKFKGGQRAMWFAERKDALE